jgi:hypothetical protein
MSAANIAFAQSPPGIGRKRPSLPGQLPGDRASAVPLQLPQMRPVGWKGLPLGILKQTRPPLRFVIVAEHCRPRTPNVTLSEHG